MRTGHDGDYGTVFYIGPFKFQRNLKLTQGFSTIENLIYWEHGKCQEHGYGSLTFEQIEELYLAAKIMKQEYETGKEVEWDT